MVALFLAVIAAQLFAFSPALAQSPSSVAGAQTQLSAATTSMSVPTLTTASSSPTLAVSSVGIPLVPFYSQFTDIQSSRWQKVGCGITDLTMIIDYYHPNAVSVSTMLKKGIAAGAYDQNAGWIYAGLITLSHQYGLEGTYYDLSGLSTARAFERFQEYLQGGPVILSVHYKFDPKSTIPHLVVINGIKNGIVYYNDPATTKGTKQIPVADFLKGWKRKVIVIRPVPQKGAAVAVAEK